MQWGARGWGLGLRDVLPFEVSCRILLDSALLTTLPQPPADGFSHQLGWFVRLMSGRDESHAFYTRLLGLCVCRIAQFQR